LGDEPTDTDRNMNKIISVALLCSTTALAEPQLICDPCTPPPIKRLHAPAEDLAVLAFGFLVLGTGTAISAAHFFTSDHNRGFDLIPVAGPLISAAQGDHGAGWTTGLVFAAWAQLTGTLTVAIAFDHMKRVMANGTGEPYPTWRGDEPANP
jgi:hypothetical protein